MKVAEILKETERRHETLTGAGPAAQTSEDIEIWHSVLGQLQAAVDALESCRLYCTLRNI